MTLPRFAIVSWFLSSLALLVVTSCADGEPCDPGQELVGNYCAAGDDGDGMGGGPAEPAEPAEEFGRVCAEDSECGGAAPSCAKAPGSSDGICSVLGCDSDPNAVVCPIGWSCFSLGDVCTED